MIDWEKLKELRAAYVDAESRLPSLKAEMQAAQQNYNDALNEMYKIEEALQKTMWPK